MSIEYSILIAVAALASNAFFVGSEFALLSARRTQIELLALKGSIAAKTVLKAMDDVSLSLAGGQLGVTLSSLVFGAISEPLVAHSLEPVLAATGLPVYLLHPFAFVIALILMVSMHVVIGEMIPKNLSLADPTKSALRLVPSLFAFVQTIKPIITGLNMISNGIVRLLGLKPRREVRSSFSRDEVAGFVKESQREGLITKDEEYRLSGSLDFEYRTIEQAILSVDDIVVAPYKTTARGVEELSVKTGFSRFPISDGKEGFVGYVHLKDIMHVSDRAFDSPIPRVRIRTLGEITPHTTLMDALTEMRRLESHILQVRSGGKTYGVVMLEDVLEELVGPISQVK
ncbi:HlyC/CorC family transporter [Candidatus Saccharibacteria bacterium]|nr:HlyC/CorC family transporter [Candidatus Saccharibacteria bacterium]